MPPLGIQPLGIMMEIELNMLVDCSKLKNINSETTHKLDNTIGKKLTHALNAIKFMILDITIKEVGLLFKMDKFTELNGGFHQTVPQVLMLFGNLLLDLAAQLQFQDALFQVHSISTHLQHKTMDLVLP